MSKRDREYENNRQNKHRRYHDYDDYDEQFIDIFFAEYEEEDKSNWEQKTIECELNSIDDLIKLGEMYDPNERAVYNVDLKTMNALVEPLKKLQNMIGMKSVKESILNQIIYYLQDFEDKCTNMLHTVVEGAPGTGKTDLGKILSQIYLKMGFLKTDYFKVVKRSDLIGQYLGQTAIKTQKEIDAAKGGVLFIDEAYSLGNPEGRDSFSKECIDTINQNLSENKGEFVCIIAGYKNDLKKSFFSYNAGLERRFPFRYTIDEYTSSDFKNIFYKIAVKDNGWMIDDIPVDFYEDNKHYLKFNGGDLETLFQLCKIAHSRRVLFLDKSVKKILTIDDLKQGLELFKNNDEVKNREHDTGSFISNLYM